MNKINYTSDDFLNDIEETQEFNKIEKNENNNVIDFNYVNTLKKIGYNVVNNSVTKEVIKYANNIQYSINEKICDVIEVIEIISNDVKNNYLVIKLNNKDIIEVETSIISDCKKLQSFLNKNGIFFTIEKKGLFEVFIQNYLNNIKDNNRKNIKTLRPTKLGWNEINGDKFFTIANKNYYYNKTINNKVYISNFRDNDLDMFVKTKTTGNIEVYKKCLSFINNERFLQHQFSYLTMLSSIFNNLTNLSQTICLFSTDSGTGKTTVSRLAGNFFGDTNFLEVTKSDTKNSIDSKLGILNSIALYCDELSSKIQKDESFLEDFVFEMENGRTKQRLNVDSSLKNVNTFKNTFVFSSNTSAINLFKYSQNIEAQLLRILEIDFNNVKFNTEDVKNFAYINQNINKNYGFYDEFLKYFILNKEYFLDKYNNLFLNYMTKFKDNKFRHTCNTLSSVMIVREILEKINLVNFNEQLLNNYINSLIKNKIDEIKSVSITENIENILSNVLSSDSNILITYNLKNKVEHYNEEDNIHLNFNKQILLKYNKDTKRLTISKSHLNKLLKDIYKINVSNFISKLSKLDYDYDLKEIKTTVDLTCKLNKRLDCISINFEDNNLIKRQLKENVDFN